MNGRKDEWIHGWMIDVWIHGQMMDEWVMNGTDG